MAGGVTKFESVTGAAVLADLKGLVHILTCGSVDDGKSTLIGRLLWDASDLPDDTRAVIQRQAGADGVPDVSLLLDGLVAEREQGITIDIAWRFFDADERRYVVIDSPGHEQYTRNMASGASHADVAIMLIDARHGVKRQTRRHAAILDLVGVKRVVLAVNKMDMIDWSETRFREIESDFGSVARRFNFADAIAIPVSAKFGDNVARRSAAALWYLGPTVLDHLASIPSRGSTADGGFRLPVQTVLRGDQDFRGLAGTVARGAVKIGDVVRDAASGRSARVKRIATMDRDLDAAVTGRAIVLQLDSDVDVARGAMLSAPEAPPLVTRGLDTRMVWLADEPLDPSHGLLLRTATDLVPVTSSTIRARLDLETLAQIETTTCGVNDIVLADFALARPVAIDLFADSRETGSFVLVDALTGATLAGGVVMAAKTGAGDHVGERGAFRLTAELLQRGVCAGLEPSDLEFRRRAEEVAIILRAAGVAVDVD